MRDYNEENSKENIIIDNINELYYGIYELKKNTKSYILTKNYTPSKKIYNEKLFQYQTDEYRVWDPKRSKLGALYKKNVKILELKNLNILYLGASFGTTVSHISDILYESSGMIYAVEFSEVPMNVLMNLSTERENIIPIYSNANFPETYKYIVNDIDLIFQDISQPNQIEIALKNLNLFLKNKGYLILIIKAKSISSTIKTKDIYKNEIKKINKQKNLKILKMIDLSPFHKDHLCVIIQLNS